MKKNSLIIIVLLVMIVSCNGDDEISATCELTTLISSEEYQNAPSDELTIINLEISDDCLTINFRAGGCNGKSWEYKLIDSDNIDFLVTTDEPSTGQLAQRNLRLSLKNVEDCEAVITKAASFDISNLRIEGENSVELIVVNGIFPVTYEY